MQMGNMRFDPPLAGVAVLLLIARQAVALADIIRQLLYQHRRVAFAVVLD